MRRLKGMADLMKRQCRPLNFDRDSVIERYRAALVGDELPALTILKARSSREWSFQGPGALYHGKFDVALGSEANFVILGVAGEWEMNGPQARFENLAAVLRARLDGFALDNPHTCAPSLSYASAGHPTGVQLEITTYCNLHCGYCNHRRLPVKRHTTLEEFGQILKGIDFTYVTEVDLTGLGEPLLHPALPKIVAEIRKRGQPQSISVVTNGTLATVDRCRPLFEAGLNSISVSLDSLDPIQFSASRVGASLDTVCGNVINLARFRQSNPELTFALRLKPVLLAEEPYEEAERILRFSAEHGLDKPQFGTLDRRRTAVDRYESDLQIRDWVTHSADKVASWVDRRWAELTATPLNKTKGESSLQRQSLPWTHPCLREELDVCDWVIDTAYIGGDGFCIPCCQQMGDLPRPQIASIFDKPLSRLWNDELLYAYRLPLSLGLLPTRCQGCSYAPSEGDSFRFGMGDLISV